MIELRRCALIGALVALGGYADDDGDAPPGDAGPESYLLVHRAFAGAWNWDGVVERIEAAGDEALAIDLPAHGDDVTAVADATLDAYTARVVEALDAAAAPVVLVGHSMGGLVVSQAAEARPDKVKRLVYVAAFLVPDGTSLLNAAAEDGESTLGSYVTPSADGMSTTLAEEGILGSLCSDCSEEQADAIAARLRPEPLGPSR
jgi:pimeloyl-ACP methyl ester carboxylesterase